MGWFDNEQQEGNPAAPGSPQPSAAPPRPTPAPASTPSSTKPSESGSTLGRQIHIDGTIVCEEDLTIIGHVEGTIRAKGTLVIAKEADVRAKIDGQRVVVHGKVDGNVQGAERVTLGQTAHLTGNIDTPMLEIIEGAHFKGSVDMKPPQSEPVKTPVAAPVSQAKKDDESAARGAASKPSSVDDKGGKEDPAKVQKQATP
jgi:cytoskeletal protein CcmA (bactofilin family)